MSGEVHHDRPQNLLLVFLLLLIILFTAFHEGYFHLISPLFWLTLAAGFSISTWLALSISTRRFLSLLFCIFIIEYIKETIGIRSGLWTYRVNNGSYNFGVWAWVLGGVTAYTLATEIVIKQIRKLKLSLPGWMNAVIILLISVMIPLTLGEYRSGAGGLFFSFYAVLMIIGVLSAIRMDFHIVAGIAISAWIVGNPSEYVGSVNSGVWIFTHNPLYPPFFLLAGCWPLEILAQYILSAIVANEPLNQYARKVNGGVE